MSDEVKLGFFDWLRVLTGNAPSELSSEIASTATVAGIEMDPFADIDENSGMTKFNPANGLPMVGEEGGVDVMGNAFGCTSDDWLSGDDWLM